MLFKVDYLLTSSLDKPWVGIIPVFESRQKAEEFCDARDLSYNRICERKDFVEYDNEI